jgi:hypothetical protein
MATSSGGGTSGARSTIGICFFFSLKSAALNFHIFLPFYDCLTTNRLIARCALIADRNVFPLGLFLPFFGIIITYHASSFSLPFHLCTNSQKLELLGY